MRCGQCGYEAPTGAAACPACGAPLPRRGGRADGAPTPVGPDPFASPKAAAATRPRHASGTGSIPWERERSVGALFETIRLMLVETGPTFEGAARHAPIGPALLFSLILGTVAGVAQAMWTIGFVLGGAGAPGLTEVLTLAVTTIVGAPVGIVVSTFVLAAAVHLTLVLLGGPTHGYAATLRTYAFAFGATAPFALLPGVGSVIQTIWGLVIVVQGLHRIHGVSGTKAVLAILLPVLLLAAFVGVNLVLLTA